MRILAIKPSSFGDIIHLFPALALMRKKFPDAELDFVVNPEFSPLLDYSPFPVSRRIFFERHKLASRRFLPELFALRRALRACRYDLVMDFQGLFRSGFVAFLCRTGCRVGFRGARERSAELFYDRRIAAGSGHAVERYGELVRQCFGIDDELFQPALPPPPPDVVLPPLPENYVVLLPGARWESKRFPPEFFRRLCEEVSRRCPGCGFVAAGSASEREIAGAIGGGAVNLAGRTTLPQLLALLRGAAAVAGNDSGPLHAAAAFGRPVFGFYGATDPALTGPWGGNCRFFTAGCGCAGCLKRLCPDGSYRCWQLDVGEVADAVADAVKKSRGSLKNGEEKK